MAAALQKLLSPFSHALAASGASDQGIKSLIFRENSCFPMFPNPLCVVFMFLPPDEFDAYIIVSFVNATLVLSIGETVEEVTDSGFLGTTPTLSCSLLGEDALVQVGVVCPPPHHIFNDNERLPQDYKETHISINVVFNLISVHRRLSKNLSIVASPQRCTQMVSATSEQTSV